jgi:hypothetical protein
VGSRVGLDRCEISRSHRDLIPDRPARSQSLYRLSYPTHWCHNKHKYNIQFLKNANFYNVKAEGVCICHRTEGLGRQSLLQKARYNGDAKRNVW